MKVKFWKHYPLLFIFYPVFMACSLAFIVAGAIMIGLGNTGFLPLLAIGLLCLLALFCLLFFDKRSLSKVVFSDEGIEWQWCKKQMMFISWDEITDIMDTWYGKGSYYLSFVADNKRIDVDLTKKMYNTIIFLCPYQSIKTMIDNNDKFKWCHREK